MHLKSFSILTTARDFQDDDPVLLEEATTLAKVVQEKLDKWETRRLLGKHLRSQAFLQLPPKDALCAGCTLDDKSEANTVSFPVTISQCS